MSEPLITVSLWADFVRATTMTDKQDADAALYQAISELPQPNRDTLAFLMLHLQRVSSTPECKMPISNLAKVFGPTLAGSRTQEPSVALSEIKYQVAVSNIFSNVDDMKNEVNVSVIKHVLMIEALKIYLYLIFFNF